MGRLILVRHGQASFLADDYDTLSPLGAEQAERLGRHWAARGRPITRLLTGPLKRQRGSAEALVAGLRAAGREVADASLDPTLDEYDAFGVIGRAVPALIRAADADVARWSAQIARREGDVGRAKERLFRHVTSRWVRGELAVGEIPRYADFRRRVVDGLRATLAGCASGASVVAVTSGGVIGAAVAWALGADDPRALELSWVVRNASVTELLFRSGSDAPPTLLAFNVIDHLPEPRLVTYR